MLKSKYPPHPPHKRIVVLGSNHDVMTWQGLAAAILLCRDFSMDSSYNASTLTGLVLRFFIIGDYARGS